MQHTGAQIVPSTAALAALVLLAGALSCGGRAAEEPSSTQTSSPRPGAVPTAPPSSPGSTPPSAPVAVPLPAGLPPVPVPAPIPEVDLARAAAENVLLTNCGYCHGPAADPAASGGIRFIGDLSRLAEAGLIVAQSSATSLLIRVMRDGSMPPPDSPYPPVTEADINTVAQYIDTPRFWPGSSPPPVEDGGAPTPVVDASADGG